MLSSLRSPRLRPLRSLVSSLALLAGRVLAQAEYVNPTMGNVGILLKPTRTGDEDGGGMGAFVVFSMGGFYPVTSGVPIYSLGRPMFDEVTLPLPGGKRFTIVAENSSHENKYIQSLKLNGGSWSKVRFTHADLAKGGSLKIEMGAVPNTALGTEAQDLPPSALALDPRKID